MLQLSVSFLMMLPCLIADTDSESRRIQYALAHANKLIRQCERPDERCVETVIHDGVFQSEPYRARVSVESVTLDDNNSTQIKGTVRAFRKSLADYRTDAERREISDSSYKTKQLRLKHADQRRGERTVGTQSSSSDRRRRDEMRKRKREHKDLLARLNRIAEDRQDQVELVGLELLSKHIDPEDVAGERHIDVVVSIERFDLRPGLEEIKEPAAIGTLHGWVNSKRE